MAMNSLAVGSATIEIEATSIVIDSGSSLIFASQEDAGRINSVSHHANNITQDQDCWCRSDPQTWL